MQLLLLDRTISFDFDVFFPMHCSYDLLTVLIQADRHTRLYNPLFATVKFTVSSKKGFVDVDRELFTRWPIYFQLTTNETYSMMMKIHRHQFPRRQDRVQLEEKIRSMLVDFDHPLTSTRHWLNMRMNEFLVSTFFCTRRTICDCDDDERKWKERRKSPSWFDVCLLGGLSMKTI